MEIGSKTIRSETGVVPPTGLVKAWRSLFTHRVGEYLAIVAVLLGVAFIAGIAIGSLHVPALTRLNTGVEMKNQPLSEAAVDEQHAEVMRRRKASYDARKSAATREKGLIIVHTGTGKGKTGSALGMVFRALGHGMRVGVVQFTKGAIDTGEAAFARQLEGRVDFYTLGEGYTWETQDRQRDTGVARQAWERARTLIEDPRYQIIVLDELNIVLKYGYLPLDEVLDTLRHKREDLHVIVTGRNAKDELIELADLVTEMKLIKHPYKNGIKAQKGIEY